MGHKKPTKVAICMPVSGSQIHTKTAFSLIHTMNRQTMFEKDFFIEISCDVVGNRYRLVDQAKKSGATHLLFVDYDMFFPPDALEKLIEADKDIIGAAYNRRVLPLKSTAYPLDKEKATGMYKCDVIGMGLMLIKMEVFDKIEEPWFIFGRDEKNNMVIGEDGQFCRQAQKAGYEIWADDTLKVMHLGEFAF